MTVAGVFESGRTEHDGALVFANIQDVRGLTPGGTSGEGLRIRFRDAMQAPALAAQLRAGSVSINGGGGFRPDAPMGGFGRSGIGRELGHWGIHEYLEPQHIQWPA